MRWLPYPTRRSPHRRFIACLVACSYLLQPVVYAVDIGALEESPKTTVLTATPPKANTEQNPKVSPPSEKSTEEASSAPTATVTVPKTEGEGTESLCAAMTNKDSFKDDFDDYKQKLDFKLEKLHSVYQRVYRNDLLKNAVTNQLLIYQNGKINLMDTVEEICSTRASLEQQTESVNSLLAKARGEKKPDACASSSNSARTTIDSAIYINNQYKSRIKKRLKSLQEQHNHRYTLCRDDAYSWQPLAKTKAPDHLGALKQAFTLIWGNPWDAKEIDEKVARAGLFSSLILKLKQEGEETVKRETDLLAKKAEVDKIPCGSVAGARDVRTDGNKASGSGRSNGKDPQGAIIGADGKIDPSCTGGNEYTVPGCKTSGSSSSCVIRKECQGKTGSVDLSGVQAGNTPLPIDSSRDPQGRQRPAGNGEDQQTAGGGNQTKDSSSWMPSGSTLLMVGGGVAAVAGGVILYKKNQDDKAKAKAHAEELEAIALANVTEQQNQSATATTTSTSTSTSTDSTVGATPTTQQASHGSTLSINGVPAQAKVGSNIGTVTIKILGPNNVMTQNSDTDVTISCDSPSPCTLTGQLTVNTDLGEAQFSNVQFTGPHKNVRLKFSAPGFADAISAAEFDVTR